jgi:hypothetical protein
MNEKFALLYVFEINSYISRLETSEPPVIRSMFIIKDLRRE